MPPREPYIAKSVLFASLSYLQLHPKDTVVATGSLRPGTS